MELSGGAPWEIRQATINAPDLCIIDLYTKSGSVDAYRLRVVHIPPYDMAFAVLTAGDSLALIDILAQTFLPVFKGIRRAQTLKALNSVYVATMGVDGSLALIVDEGPGLVIRRWVGNGKTP